MSLLVLPAADRLRLWFPARACRRFPTGPCLTVILSVCVRWSWRLACVADGSFGLGDGGQNALAPPGLFVSQRRAEGCPVRAHPVGGVAEGTVRGVEGRPTWVKISLTMGRSDVRAGRVIVSADFAKVETRAFDLLTV